MTELVQKAKRIVVLCGAGISTNSGIPDFQTAYAKTPNLKKALTRSTYKQHYETLSKFLFQVMESSPKPTLTHLFLKHLSDMGRLVRCYTMNIDGLEEAAGVSNVVQLHGNIQSGRCGKHPLSREDLKTAVAMGLLQYSKLHKCNVRPNIVFYGESLNMNHLKQLKADVQSCDLVLCLGTSLKVAPASNILEYAKAAQKHIVVVNKEDLKIGISVVGDCDKVTADWF
jgi:NAD-dependent SIR2 family protein deacetylase